MAGLTVPDFGLPSLSFAGETLVFGVLSRPQATLLSQSDSFQNPSSWSR